MKRRGFLSLFLGVPNGEFLPGRITCFAEWSERGIRCQAVFGVNPAALWDPRLFALGWGQLWVRRVGRTQCS